MGLFGEGVQYVEDVALGATPTGTLGMGVGSTAVPTAVGSDGDAVSVWTTLFGAPNVVLRDTTGAAVATGTQYAHDSPMGSTPTGTNIHGRASSAVPSAVSADGDAVSLWASRLGALIQAQVPHIGLNGDPWSLVHEAAQYTSTQTSTVLVAGGASEKIVVTQIQIQAFGTTNFDLQVYFGTGAFARGTNRAVFDGTFKPSSTSAPGVVMNGPFISGTNGDDLMVTTSAAGSVTINVWYYIVT